MKPVLVALLFVALAFAGCTDAGNGTESGTGAGGGADDEVVQIHRPEWQVGDWWTWDSTFGSQTVAITSDNGDTWTMDTDSVQTAFFHSNNKEISYLGEIRKDDLAGSQDGTPVKYFDWPLEDGKTWTTQWDGLQFDMVAHVADEDTAHIIGTSDERTYELVYEASAKWFTSVASMDAQGEEQWRMEVTESGSGFTGELVRVHAVVAESNTYTGPTATSNGLIDASEASDDADAYLVYDVSCELGEFAFGIGTAQGAVAGNTGADVAEPQGSSITSDCPFSHEFEGVVGTEPGNGDNWGMYLQSSGPDFEITYTLYWRNFERITL